MARRRRMQHLVTGSPPCFPVVTTHTHTHTHLSCSRLSRFIMPHYLRGGRAHASGGAETPRSRAVATVSLRPLSEHPALTAVILTCPPSHDGREKRTLNMQEKWYFNFRPGFCSIPLATSRAAKIIPSTVSGP